MMPLTIYTDGAARGNPGRGGFGAILQWGDHRKEIAQGYAHTTNNRMELMAVIEALKHLKKINLDVVIYCDSAYVVHAVEKGWLTGWVRTGFKGKKNADLWKQYLELSKNNRIRFVWIKGHAENPMNNRCDLLATQAADRGPWLRDSVYENNGENNLF